MRDAYVSYGRTLMIFSIAGSFIRVLYERFSLQPCEQRLIGHSRVTVIDMLRSHLLDQKVSSYCCCYCCHFISASLILRGIPHSDFSSFSCFALVPLAPLAALLSFL